MDGELTPRQHAIVQIVARHDTISITQIAETIDPQFNVASFNRDVADLVKHRYVTRLGRGRFITYKLSTWYRLMVELPPNKTTESLLRHSLLSTTQDGKIFTPEEHRHLESLTHQYQTNIADLPLAVFRRELEQLATDTWAKSVGGEAAVEQSDNIDSPIEASMVLRHKACLEYILNDRTLGRTIDLQFLSRIYGMLMLGQSANHRPLTPTTRYPPNHAVPVSFVPMLREFIECMCNEVNGRHSVYERALLAFFFISYLQPFEDGNKRTGRMVSNAILMTGDACPLSYRSIDVSNYQKVITQIDYDGRLEACKRIFIAQMECAVKNYFKSDLAMSSHT